MSSIAASMVERLRSSTASGVSMPAVVDDIPLVSVLPL